MDAAKRRQLEEELTKTSKIRDEQNALVSAWDERKRIFEEMRRADLTDKDREDLKTQYKTTSSEFDKVRSSHVR